MSAENTFLKRLTIMQDFRPESVLENRKGHLKSSRMAQISASIDEL